jgi:hypothetical protein
MLAIAKKMIDQSSTGERFGFLNILVVEQFYTAAWAIRRVRNATLSDAFSI